LIESLTLSLAGGAFGIGTGYAAIRLIAWLGAAGLPRHGNLHMDGRVLAFTTMVALLTGLIFGILPVFHLLRRDLNAVFRQTGRTGTAERRSLGTRSALVISQVSLAFVLLTGAGLLSLSFSRLLSVDPGFRPQHVLTAQFSLPLVRYRDDAQARTFVSRLLDSIRVMPGVDRAGASTALPFSTGNNATMIAIEGYTPGPAETPPTPGWNTVDAGYLQAMGIPLLRGRNFSEADGPDSEKVAVIDQNLARKFWPHGDPVGAKLRRGPNSNVACTIIGVAGSVKTGDLGEQNPVGQVYFHYKQFVPRAMFLTVRSGREDPQLAASIGRQMLAGDPEMPLFDVRTMPQRVSLSLVNRRAALVIWLIFAGLALALSAIGIYGVLAYAVTQRTREFGIRVALGAGAGDVLRIVVGHGVRLVAIGLVFGAAAAFGLTRLMAAMLYHVKATDPVVFISMAAALMLVALAASLLPSLRALRVRPAVAMRQD
jgi:putative ABC transport system permease protein